MDAPIPVSIILPVYNTERHLARAVDSLRAQTLTNFELILVDDGSTDGSGEICDRYAREDPRISVIHKKNGGAAAARNRAMETARGRYFFFSDADDWAAPGMLEAMVGFADEHELHYVIAGFYIHTYYSLTQYHTTEHVDQTRVYESAQAFREDAHRLFDKNLLYPPWNKLYRADYLREQGIRFPDTFWDDFPFNLAVMRDVQRVGVLGASYYHFTRAREESETARFRPDFYQKREEEHAWMLELYDHWDIHDEASREMIARRYVERLFGCIENVACLACHKSRREKIMEIRRMIESDAAKSALRQAKLRSFYTRLMALPIRWRCARLCYLEGALLSAVKRRNVRLFAQLKANR